MGNMEKMLMFVLAMLVDLFEVFAHVTLYEWTIFPITGYAIGFVNMLCLSWFTKFIFSTPLSGKTELSSENVIESIVRKFARCVSYMAFGVIMKTWVL